MINVFAIACILLAAICKAGADTLMFHFDSSVFKHKDPRFWNPNISWQYAHFLRFTKYRIDAWHLFNSTMIVGFCAAFCLHESVTHYWFEPIIAFILSGFLFNNMFNLFYNHVFK